MKILRVISHLDVGGVQRQMLLAFKALRELNVECHVCCIDKMGDLAPKFEEEGFTVHHIPFSSRLDPIALYKLNRLVKNEKFDVVHSQMYAANMSTNAALRIGSDVALINGYHNQLFVNGDKQRTKVVRSINRPDAILAVGENVKKALVESGVPEAKICVVTNGVVGPEQPLLMPVYQSQTPLRLMWAGRFVPQKRADFLVEVALACKEQHVPIRMSLFGEGPKFYHVQRQIKEAGVEAIISLPGVVSNVFEPLSSHDLYLSASFREGFPNALLEALIAGRPAIVSDIDPHKEVLEGTGAGICVAVKVQDWVDTFKQLLANRDQLIPMADKARHVGLSHHIDHTARKTVDLYKSVLTVREKKDF